MWAIPTVGWTGKTFTHGLAQINQINRSGSCRTDSISLAGCREESFVLLRTTASAIAARKGESSGVCRTAKSERVEQGVKQG